MVAFPAKITTWNYAIQKDFCIILMSRDYQWKVIVILKRCIQFCDLFIQ